MALFKCKMCGGDLEIVEGASIAECEYCGTKQTVPRAIDENLQNLFNRANTLRIKSEFDKAEKLYEKLIQADSTQSEAYWGLILCKYGIEYVDDPATFKKVPTCHRASFESIVADDDYKSALENADMSQRAIYEEQAKEIDRIQKDILALAQKEENYDVFICYKETGADGRRTQDSVIANDIYYQLTQEGFKVFYAAITLEGKLGSAYEPIIFAALHSAKVMLAIGTKPEHFNAVWVKNEWSRYLKIIQRDRSKLLIPCYRDMDAYELPDEFAHLQAQDMSKIGFINDVVRGIKKVIVKDEPKPTVVKETVANSPANANIVALLQRVSIFLEDKDWEKADEYCEKVLNQDPKNAQAYLGKLLADCKCSKLEDLQNCTSVFGKNKNYEKAVRFGDEKLRNALHQYDEIVHQKKSKKENETNALLAEIDRLLQEGTYESFSKGVTLFLNYYDEQFKAHWEKIMSMGREQFSQNYKRFPFPDDMVERKIMLKTQQKLLWLFAVSKYNSFTAEEIRKLNNDDKKFDIFANYYCDDDNDDEVEENPYPYLEESLAELVKFGFLEQSVLRNIEYYRIKNAETLPNVDYIEYLSTRSDLDSKRKGYMNEILNYAKRTEKSFSLNECVTNSNQSIDLAAFELCKELQLVRYVSQRVSYYQTPDSLYKQVCSVLNELQKAIDTKDFAKKAEIVANIDWKEIRKQLELLGGYKDSREWLKKIDTMEKEAPNVKEQLAKAYEHLSKKWNEAQEAVVEFDKIIKNFPNERLGYIGKALSTINTEQKSELILIAKTKQVSPKFAEETKKLLNMRVYPTPYCKGRTLLTSMCYSDRMDDFRALIDMGANIDQEGDRDGTPLWHLCAHPLIGTEEQKDLLRKKAALLIDMGASIDVSGFKAGSTTERIPLFNFSTDAMIAKKIKEKHPEASRAGSGGGGGCYVATCVYGSYDCPEVWTLRRFRDDTLGSTWYGRLFIHLYYAISPTLVKWFGNTNWFKNLWRGTLNRMVANLQAKGVEDTPYDDKVW